MKKTLVLLAALLSATCFFSFAQENKKPEYGYKVSDFMSTPKVGGYIIGGYKYTDQEGAHGGPGFNCRLIRLYVDGSIFNDFKYRIQFQANGTSPHVKDFFIEWAKYKEFSVKSRRVAYNGKLHGMWLSGFHAPSANYSGGTDGD